MEPRMVRSLLLLIVVSMLAVGCTKVNKVTAIDEVKDGKMGLVYVLPKTQVVVEIPITVSVKNGALEFASLDSVSPGVKEKEVVDCKLYYQSKNHPVTTSIKVGEYALTGEPVPDLDRVYNIDLDSSFLKDAKKNLQFNDKGMIVSGGFSAKDKTLEFTVQVVKTAVSIATPFLAPIPRPAPQAPSEADAKKAQADNAAAERQAIAARKAACRKMRTDALAAYNKKEGERNRFKRLKENVLFGVNAGGVDRSFDAYKKRIDDIDAYVAAETGDGELNKTVKLTYRRVLTDAELKQGEIKLFAIEDDTIVVDSLEYFSEGGKSPYVSRRLVGVGKGPVVSLHIKPTPNDLATAVSGAASYAEPKGEKGLYYRLPGLAEAYFTNGEAKSKPQLLPIAQWGALLALPTTMHSTDSAISFEFFADTGAIKTIGTENKAIDMEQVGKLGDAGVSLVQAIYASNDEITKLKQEKEKLTLQKDIRDLKTSLQTGQ
ncbi:DUF4831 family protein [Solidesulfovibrio sp.]|uniref:DUF4831 family protein n=1 Tax=Solidesulfovibrio sp. TaxID=2910990 RepID=UPI00262429EA|nr:DUF4831 family protein [Solidesulfovibrio sp.]